VFCGVAATPPAPPAVKRASDGPMQRSWNFKTMRRTRSVLLGKNCRLWPEPVSDRPWQSGTSQSRGWPVI